ncbi:DUF1294 domain-containing protein [Niallia taxi]|uniref:DUF1294 domain-containing protein n=1 Tax=Niallia taxi TaxID=2499688 RepID=UPI0015F66492|nr:DUF1294 domain-containing protein [Niallia taxi]
MEVSGLIFIYIFVINMIGTYVMYYDKQQAKRGNWRVEEKTLFGIAVIGGSAGVFIGMRRYHHKTRKPSFKFGIPAIFVIQIALVIFGAYYF